MTDWIEGYKLGFKEGVIALKTYLENNHSYIETDYEGDHLVIVTEKDELDEICEELEGDNG